MDFSDIRQKKLSQVMSGIAKKSEFIFKKPTEDGVVKDWLSTFGNRFFSKKCCQNCGFIVETGLR